MADIDIHGLSTDDLVTLIRRASAELANRFPPGQGKSQAEKQKPPAPLPPEIKRPTEDDAAFILRIKSRVSQRGYIKAAERQRVAAIAKEYPEWVKRQELPLDSGTGSWKKTGDYLSTPLAKER